MSDPSVFPYIGAGALLLLLAIGFFRFRFMGAWPLLTVSATCLGVIAILPMSYISAVETAEWVRSLDARTPRRDLSASELRRFGPTAQHGVIYAADDTGRRLYCIRYGDGDLLTALETRGSKNWDALNGSGPCSDR